MVQYLDYQRLQQKGTTYDHPCSGCSRVTMQRQDRYIRLSNLRGRFETATKTAITAQVLITIVSVVKRYSEAVGV